MTWQFSVKVFSSGQHDFATFNDGLTNVLFINAFIYKALFKISLVCNYFMLKTKFPETNIFIEGYSFVRPV